MPTRPHYLPFQNMSTFQLMQWFYDSSLMKSLGMLNNLVHQVLLAPNFNTNDLTGFDAAKEAKCLDNFDPSAKEECSSGSGSKQLNDGWIETSIPIHLPVFHVKGFLYRKPLEVLKAAYQEHSGGQHSSTFLPLKITGIPPTNPLLSVFILNSTALMHTIKNTRRYDRNLDLSVSWRSLLHRSCSGQTPHT